MDLFYFFELHFSFFITVICYVYELVTNYHAQSFIQIAFTIVYKWWWWWGILVVWEIVGFYYDSYAGYMAHLDLRDGLALYPCSIYLYVMPLVFWGDEFGKKVAYGYLLTLGMLGAVVNFYFKIGRAHV